MNKLNNVIIEGDIKEIDKTSFPMSFKIESDRHYKDEAGNCVDEVFTFTVICNSRQIVNKIKNKLEVGDEVRIVGRLESYDEVYIVAECIEKRLKPKVR